MFSTTNYFQLTNNQLANTMTDDNLTDPMEIKHALERKLGYGAVKKTAAACGVTLPAISNTIHGQRGKSGRPGNKGLLQHLANVIGQPVHGVAPDKEVKTY